jgi:large subunit ribosomal protein L6
MSKIGKKPVQIPAGVTFELANLVLTVKGPKGQLTEAIPAGVTIELKDNEAFVDVTGVSNQDRANHGLARSLFNNMVEGVANGYVRKLEMVGTGYRVAKKGQNLVLSIGFSHPVEVVPTPGITLDIEGNTIIVVSGISKHMVGQMTANIRRIRPPEPYKGKGIRYQDEVVRRKAGKTTAK